MNKIHFILLLIVLNILCAQSRKTFGGGSRKTSNSRTYYKAKTVPTVKSHVNTQGNNYYGNNNYYGSQKKASHIGTTPRYAVRTQPTIRQVTQKSVYQQNAVYTQRPVPVQRPVNTQRPVYPQQASYPKQPYPQQNYPTYHQPSYTGNYSPGGYYKKKDHSVRNTVLAGLGGSALGMYLGYKLGGLTHSMNNPYYGGYGGYGGVGGSPGMPQYSVVHHYHHGDAQIIQNAVVESNALTPCQEVSLCMPNTTPLCVSNGTIYCVTPVDKTNICNVNSTSLPCVNSTITAPCLNETDGNCTSTELTTQNLEIPCVSSINVFGDFTTNKLSVQNADNTATGPNTLTNQGISQQYCVSVIAEPLVEPKELSNQEYVRYLNENPAAKQEANMKLESFMNSIGGFMFF